MNVVSLKNRTDSELGFIRIYKRINTTQHIGNNNRTKKPSKPTKGATN